jgi:hypothetical protein
MRQTLNAPYERPGPCGPGLSLCVALRLHPTFAATPSGFVRGACLLGGAQAADLVVRCGRLVIWHQMKMIASHFGALGKGYEVVHSAIPVNSGVRMAVSMSAGAKATQVATMVLLATVVAACGVNGAVAEEPAQSASPTSQMSPQEQLEAAVIEKFGLDEVTNVLIEQAEDEDGERYRTVLIDITGPTRSPNLDQQVTRNSARDAMKVLIQLLQEQRPIAPNTTDFVTLRTYYTFADSLGNENAHPGLTYVISGKRLYELRTSSVSGQEMDRLPDISVDIHPALRY